MRASTPGRVRAASIATSSRASEVEKRGLDRSMPVVETPTTRTPPGARTTGLLRGRYGARSSATTASWW